MSFTISFSNEFKKEVFNKLVHYPTMNYKVLAKDGSGETISTTEDIVFGTPSAGSVSISAPVDLGINTGGKVVRIRVIARPSGSGVDTTMFDIDLNEEEEADFGEEAGIYRINTLTLTL